MKRLIQIICCCIVVAIAAGYIFKHQGDHLTGDRIIGLAVLALSFVLIPLFIFYRYRKTSIRKYIFPGKQEENDNEAAENH